MNLIKIHFLFAIILYLCNIQLQFLILLNYIYVFFFIIQKYNKKFFN